MIFLDVLKTGLAYLSLNVDVSIDRIAVILAIILSSNILIILKDNALISKLDNLSYIRTILVANII